MIKCLFVMLQFTGNLMYGEVRNTVFIPTSVKYLSDVIYVAPIRFIKI